MFLVLCAICALGVSADVHLEWNNFKSTHSKEYKTLEEEEHRLDIFKENLRVIDEQNAKFHAGEDTHLLGITPFADLTDEEFLQMTSCIVEATDSVKSEIPVFKPDGSSAPASYDWRTHTPKIAEAPRNQGPHCLSCWAFTAAEIVKSHFSIETNDTYFPLSPQNLVNCVSAGCAGGHTSTALNYVKTEGVALESACPYTGVNGKCQKYYGKNLYIKKYSQIKTENDMKSALVQNGPLAVAVDDKEWKLYKSGIFKAKQAFVVLTHALVADGYGTEKGEDFWLLRNSWGPNWGEKGYIRIRRNTNEFGIVNDVLAINS